MSEICDVGGLLTAGADTAAAIGAPGRRTMTFAELCGHVAGVVEVLNGFGIGAGDNLAIVLPNGPEMASAFVAMSQAATTAPSTPPTGRTSSTSTSTTLKPGLWFSPPVTRARPGLSPRVAAFP